MSKGQKRRSAAVKEEAVLRLLKGEDMELVSRETGHSMHELAAWREAYTRGGRESLKSNPGDSRDAGMEEAKRVIANLAMENEILKKVRALGGGQRP